MLNTLSFRWVRSGLLQRKNILLLVFFGLQLVELAAILHNSSLDLFSLLTAAFFFVITAMSPFWGVWLFVATIPLLSGWLVLLGTEGGILAFAAVYFAWLPHYLLKNKKSKPDTTTSFLLQLLAIIVVLNLSLAVFRCTEWPLPSRYWLEWVSSFPFVDQADPLWQINAALILLKGIVLYLMIEVEITGGKRWLVFTRTVYVQALWIVVFSLYQLVDFKIHSVNYLGLSLPFNDIHSYGSVVVLLFVVFTVQYLTEYTRGKGNRNHGHIVNKLQGKVRLNLLGAGVFFFLCLYSSSRMTWVAMGIMMSILLLQTIQNKKIIVYVLLLLLSIAYVGHQFVPTLLSSSNQSLYRLGTVLDVENIQKDKALTVRCELWNRSFKMVKEYPFTGVGIGNVYRVTQEYKDRTVGQWDRENSHNYYLQVAAELGIPTLILFFCIVSSLYFFPGTTVQRQHTTVSERIVLQSFRYGLGAYLLTMLTGHALLLSSQQFMFWSIVAIIARGRAVQGTVEKKNNSTAELPKYIGIVCFFLYIFGFCFNVLQQEPRTIPVTYGFYSEENWSGVKMRWITGRAEYYLPAGQKRLILKAMAQPVNSQRPKGLTLTISINDQMTDTVHFFNGGSKILNYNLSSVNGQDMKINFEVDRVFSPVDIGLSSDPRLLGVALGELNRLPVIPAVPGLLLHWIPPEVMALMVGRPWRDTIEKNNKVSD